MDGNATENDDFEPERVDGDQMVMLKGIGKSKYLVGNDQSGRSRNKLEPEYLNQQYQTSSSATQRLSGLSKFLTEAPAPVKKEVTF